jgi:formylglycine-generating enzyme required for sulfatase activity
VTSEDEWYKAAYYKGRSTNAGYWDYPTSSNSEPSNVLGNPTDPGNNATFYNNGYTIGSPYYRTEAGAHENSDSPYGTFDQGGNVWEWNEAVLYDFQRGVRGGGFFNYSGALRALGRVSNYPAGESDAFGFRVAEVPEPATAGLFLLGWLFVARRRHLL